MLNMCYNTTALDPKRKKKEQRTGLLFTMGMSRETYLIRLMEEKHLVSIFHKLECAQIFTDLWFKKNWFYVLQCVPLKLPPWINFYSYWFFFLLHFVDLNAIPFSKITGAHVPCLIPTQAVYSTGRQISWPFFSLSSLHVK